MLTENEWSLHRIKLLDKIGKKYIKMYTLFWFFLTLDFFAQNKMKKRMEISKKIFLAFFTLFFMNKIKLCTFSWFMYNWYFKGGEEEFNRGIINWIPTKYIYIPVRNTLYCDVMYCEKDWHIFSPLFLGRKPILYPPDIPRRAEYLF